MAGPMCGNCGKGVSTLPEDQNSGPDNSFSLFYSYHLTTGKEGWRSFPRKKNPCAFILFYSHFSDYPLSFYLFL